MLLRKVDDWCGLGETEWNKFIKSIAFGDLKAFYPEEDQEQDD